MDNHGRVFYIDHKNHTTTWQKPGSGGGRSPGGTSPGAGMATNNAFFNFQLLKIYCSVGAIHYVWYDRIREEGKGVKKPKKYGHYVLSEGNREGVKKGLKNAVMLIIWPLTEHSSLI